MELDDATVRKFKLRFAGNPKAYGSDEGGAVRQPVNDELVRGHLEGTKGIGIYPVRHAPHDQIEVKWGCCDIDTGEWSEAYALATALRGMGMKPLIERSRSKGWHIWTFAKEWVPAATMRRALLVAYQTIDLVAKEANPKSEKLDKTQLGNYLRLPYKGITQGLSDRQVMMAGWCRDNDGQPATLAEFMDADVSVPKLQIEHWASKYIEPVKNVVVLDQTADVDTERVIVNLPPKVQLLVRRGPKADRSGGMVALAFKLAESGATATEALAVLSHVDVTWGKGYAERSNGDVYLMDLVERAYS